MTCDLTDEESKAVLCARTMTPLTLIMVVETVKREALAARLTCDHEAQIRDLLEEREELLTEIRRLRMNTSWPPRDTGLALAETLTERDAEHEGGGGA